MIYQWYKIIYMCTATEVLLPDILLVFSAFVPLPVAFVAAGERDSDSGSYVCRSVAKRGPWTTLSW